MAKQTPLNLIAESFADLPPAAHELLLRLLSLVAAEGGALPEAMLKDIEDITVEGADAAWQIQQLQTILDRWTPQH